LPFVAADKSNWTGSTKWRIGSAISPTELLASSVVNACITQFDITLLGVFTWVAKLGGQGKALVHFGGNKAISACDGNALSLAVANDAISIRGERI